MSQKVETPSLIPLASRTSAIKIWYFIKMRMNTVVILIYAIEFHGFRNLTIAREKACMVITYNANMTPAARRHKNIEK